jgi:dipeptidase E
VTEYIVAMGGGGFSAGVEDASIDMYALSLTETTTPRICLLPTASGDPEEQIGRFYAFFRGRACEPSHISLFRLGQLDIDLREHLLSQDMIYVGGGSLLNLLAIWRVHGLDAILRDAWEAGIVLCGLSAGAMCWFEQAITTSTGAPVAAEGLGFLAGSMSVHWSLNPRRRLVYHQAIRDGMKPGYGVDDGAGLVYKGRKLVEVVKARPDAGATRVELVDGEIVETSLDARLLEPVESLVRSRTPFAVTELRAVREMRARQRAGGR